MMHRFFVFLLLCFAYNPLLAQDDEICASEPCCCLLFNESDREQCPSNFIHSKTFFAARQITYDSTFELALTNYDIYHPRDCGSCRPRIHFYAAPFFQKSTNRKSLGQYFAPNGHNPIIIAQNGTGDLGSIWFNLIAVPPGQFNARVFLLPTRKSAGAVFTARFDFNCLCDALSNFWIGVNTAVVNVHHDLNLCNQIIGNEVTLCPSSFANVCAAFNNPAWQAGRLSCCRLKRTGLDDVQIKLGYDWYPCNLDHISFYLVGGIPTGKRPTSFFLFEPLVGSKHGRFGVGLNTDQRLWECNGSALNWMIDVKYLYGFRATETRSFDLCRNGDWSRYLLLASGTAPATPLPGINTLTFPVSVTPRGTINLWTALHYDRCHIHHFEVGYNLWWRQKEKVRFKTVPNLNNIGIFDLAGVVMLNPTSASTATISQSIGGVNPVVSDPTFIPLSINNINLQSGEQPHAITHKFYAAFAANQCWCSSSGLLGIGASYEFAHPKTNALSQWAVFGKLGISF